MNDRLIIRDLLLRGIVGVNDEERVKRQDILLNLEIEADTRAVARNDDLEAGVNYRSVAKKVGAYVEQSSFFTVERLAEEVARLILADERVTEVKVTLEKPGALRFAESAGVSIVRRPADFK